MEAAAKVIPWSAKPVVKERTSATAEMAIGPTEAGLYFQPLDDVILQIPDEQLEALGTLFAASPLRKAMTFEAYLFVKGFGHTGH
jgi:hypothetical protein